MTNQLKQTLDTIINTINFVTNADVKSTNRKRQNVDAKYIYYKISRDNTSLSTADIGMYVNRDHASVLHGLKKFKDYYKLDQSFRKTYNTIISLMVENNFDFSCKDINSQFTELKNTYSLLVEEHHKLKLNFKKKLNDKLIEVCESIDFITLKRLQSSKIDRRLMKAVNHVLDKKRNLKL